MSFNIIVRAGTRLNQVRFHKGAPALALAQVDKYYAEGKLLSPPRKRPRLRDGLVPVTVDLLGKDGGVIGYKAKKYTNKIDVDRIGHYDPREFWEKIEDTGGRINLDKDDFYILATCEDVGVPPELAAEMVPYDTSSGEFRVHYAGFFDPGFGWSEGRAARQQGGAGSALLRGLLHPRARPDGGLAALQQARPRPARQGLRRRHPVELPGAGGGARQAVQGLAGLTKPRAEPTLGIHAPHFTSTVCS